MPVTGVAGWEWFRANVEEQLLMQVNLCKTNAQGGISSACIDSKFVQFHS